MFCELNDRRTELGVRGGNPTPTKEILVSKKEEKKIETEEETKTTA